MAGNAIMVRARQRQREIAAYKSMLTSGKMLKKTRKVVLLRNKIRRIMYPRGELAFLIAWDRKVRKSKERI